MQYTCCLEQRDGGTCLAHTLAEGLPITHRPRCFVGVALRRNITYPFLFCILFFLISLYTRLFAPPHNLGRTTLLWMTSSASRVWTLYGRLFYRVRTLLWRRTRVTCWCSCICVPKNHPSECGAGEQICCVDGLLICFILRFMHTWFKKDTSALKSKKQSSKLILAGSCMWYFWFLARQSVCRL